MKYRSEIDGLRAIAVLSVILFHAGFGLFRGGFVGVDVFFVISGYLITAIILKDLEQGRFSLLSFYEKRARRILPALFLMLMVSVPIAWKLLLPSDMEEFTRNLAAVALFSSNIQFWLDAGYWETANELNPFIHTWSLAVEEQFYLLFPLTLILIWRWQKDACYRVLLLIGTASLLLAQWGSSFAPTANFYLLPFRAWELLLGSGVVYLERSGNRIFQEVFARRQVREVLGIAGIALIVYAIFNFDENVKYPSLLTLFPTVGATLILLGASPATVVGRILSMRVLVFVGLLSFSAYLWHQPLLAFSRHLSPGELGTGQLFNIILATFLISYLSWRYVEQPYRNNTVITRDTVFKSAIACSLALIAVGITGHKTYGFVERTKSTTSYNIQQQKTVNNYGLNILCEGVTTLSSDCQTSESPEILVWGDSYAVHLVHGILASNPEARIVQLTKSVCGPFLDIAPVSRGFTAEACLKFNSEVQNRVSKSPNLKYAVLSSPFTAYLNEENAIQFRNGDVTEATLEITDREFRKTLSYLIDLGITPVVFSPPPSNGNINIGKCLSRAEYFGKNLNGCNFSLSRNSESLKDVFIWLKTISEDHKVIFLDELLCPGGICNTHDGETFIYRDHGHLSMRGSSQVGEKFDFYSLIVSK